MTNAIECLCHLIPTEVAPSAGKTESLLQAALRESRTRFPLVCEVTNDHPIILLEEDTNQRLMLEGAELLASLC